MYEYSSCAVAITSSSFSSSSSSYPSNKPLHYLLPSIPSLPFYFYSSLPLPRPARNTTNSATAATVHSRSRSYSHSHSHSHFLLRPPIMSRRYDARVSAYTSIHLSIHQSIHQSTHPSIHPSLISSTALPRHSSTRANSLPLLLRARQPSSPPKAVSTRSNTLSRQSHTPAQPWASWLPMASSSPPNAKSPASYSNKTLLQRSSTP